MNTKYHRLTLAEQEEISRGLWADENFSQIAERIGFYPSAVRVVVDYEMTLQQMIDAGKYEGVDSNINEKNFPIRGEGRQEVTIELIGFELVIKTDEVLKKLDQRGYRPARIEEFLAFSAAYSKLFKDILIVCLGSIWTGPYGDDRYAPVLNWGDSKHCLRLVWCGDIWPTNYMFAAVKTKTPL